MRYKYRVCNHYQSAGSVRRKVFLTLGMLILAGCTVVMPDSKFIIVAAGCVINLVWLWS